MRTRRAWFLLALLWLLALSPRSGAAEIVVVFTLEADWAALAGSAGVTSKTLASGHAVHQAQLGPHRVRGVQVKQGQMKTATIVSEVLKEAPADVVVSVGPAGALVDELAIGDWVAVGSYSTFTGSKRQTAFRQRTVDTRAPKGALNAVLAEHFDRLQAGDGTSARVKRAPLRSGSGDVFVSSKSQRAEARTLTQGLVVEMDIAGIDAAARRYGVPAVFWRVVSNRADEDAKAAYRRFAAGYNGRGGRALAEAIEAIPAE